MRDDRDIYVCLIQNQLVVLIQLSVIVGGAIQLNVNGCTVPHGVAL